MSVSGRLALMFGLVGALAAGRVCASDLESAPQPMPDSSAPRHYSPLAEEPAPAPLRPPKPVPASKREPQVKRDAPVKASVTPTAVKADPPALHIPMFKPSPGQGTRCGACHSVKGWMQVVFPHDKTGFPLKGRHASVTCRACHLEDFVKTLPHSCAGCHTDVHVGALGSRCENCHEEKGWAPLFDAQAHRFSAFPLTGRHALLPCESCHPNARTREFARSTLECQACHLGDYASATAKGINHAALFGAAATNCRQCHDWRSWKGARFADHDKCFTISFSWHAGIDCLSCHTSIAPTGGTCTTGTANCTGCHTHNKPLTDAIHQPLASQLYSYTSGKCYFCHTEKTL